MSVCDSTERKIARESQRQRDRETERHRERDRERQRDRETERERQRQRESRTVRRVRMIGIMRACEQREMSTDSVTRPKPPRCSCTYSFIMMALHTHRL
jgi:ribosome-binding protein aMBF1 (putative translation factor)